MWGRCEEPLEQFVSNENLKWRGIFGSGLKNKYKCPNCGLAISRYSITFDSVYLPFIDNLYLYNFMCIYYISICMYIKIYIYIYIYTQYI